MPELFVTATENLEKFGFKLQGNGPHSSRTMMLPEISICLEIISPDAGRGEYQEAIVNRNILGKKSHSTRKESYRRIRELYGLDPSIPLFVLYRLLDQSDPSARPLLSVLLACARDPLLKATVPVIAGSREDDMLAAYQFEEALEKTFPGYQKPKIRAATARHISSTWSQSCHLTGRSPKIRATVSPTPAALTMALILGYLEGHRNAALFASTWCRILDLNAAQAQMLALQAHREGYIDLRTQGTIAEITFPRFADIIEGAA